MRRVIWLGVLGVYLLLAAQTATDAQVRNHIWSSAAQIGGSVAHKINGLVSAKIHLG